MCLVGGLQEHPDLTYVDSCRNKGFLHQEVCNNQPCPSLILSLKMLCWNFSGSLEVWGAWTTHSPHMALKNFFLCSKLQSFGLFGLTVHQTYELTFGNTVDQCAIFHSPAISMLALVRVPLRYFLSVLHTPLLLCFWVLCRANEPILWKRYQAYQTGPQLAVAFALAHPYNRQQWFSKWGPHTTIISLIWTFLEKQICGPYLRPAKLETLQMLGAQKVHSHKPSGWLWCIVKFRSPDVHNTHLPSMLESQVSSAVDKLLPY